MLRKYSVFAVLAVILIIFPAVSAEIFSDDIFSDDIYSDDVYIGVIEFSSDTVDLSPEQAISAGSIFTRRLAMSVPENITVVGYNKLRRIAEQNNMSTEGYVTSRNAALIGKLAGCRYIIAGTITELNTRRVNSGISFVVKMGSTADITTSSANIRLIDTETGEILLMISDTVRTTQKDSNFTIDASAATKILPRSLGGDLLKETSANNATVSNLDTLKASSIFLLSARLTQRIIERLTGIYPKVESVSEKQVTLSAGTNSGARKGMLYLIYTDAENDKPNVAVVQVKDVKPENSTATLYAKGYGNLQNVKEGDKLFPTYSYEAKAMVKEKTFMKSRAGVSKKRKASAKSDNPKKKEPSSFMN